jgi:beta-glucosidase
MGEVRYGEGIFIGYRYYDEKQIPVQFPFGYGMSYTTFKYSNLNVSSPRFNDQDGLSLSVDVTNAGKFAGKEIVQLYVRDVKSTLKRPQKELKGFAKIELKPGETKTVKLTLDFRSFAYFHPGYGQWIAEDGEFEILVGASSSDIRLQKIVTLETTRRLPSILNRESTVRDWANDPRGWGAVKPVYEQLLARMPEMFGMESADASDHGVDVNGFVQEMPLLSLLQFQQQFLEKAPEVIVDELLEQVHGT